MAALSKHGTELYRYDTLTHRVAHMSDGHILKNDGFGWKLWRKCKPGVQPEDAASGKRLRNEERDRNEPSFCALREWFVENVPFGQRWKVLQAFEMMPDDLDGVWATLDDDCELRGRFTFEDISELGRLHAATLLEKRQLAEAKAVLA